MPHDLEKPAQQPASPLKTYREKHQLTQQELADRIGISRALAGMLETGAKPCTVNTALMIEEKLGIDRAEMLPEVFKREETPLSTAPAT